VSSFDQDEVVLLDARSGQVTQTWTVGDGPTDMANDITSTYVANSLSQDITVIDRLANTVAGTIDVTATPLTGTQLLSFFDPTLEGFLHPTGVAVTPNGRKVISANLINVTISDPGTLTPVKSILGLNTLSLSSLIANPNQAINTFLAAPVRGLGMAKVATTNDVALATCMLTGTVMRVDMNTEKLVGYTDVGDGPIGIAIANSKAYVACALSEEVYVLDVVTGAVLKTLKAGMLPVDVATNPQGDRIYVANALSGDITVIDTATDLVVDTLPAGVSIASLFTSMGIQLPSGTGAAGTQALLTGFLQGYSAGLNNPSSFGALAAGNGGNALLSPAGLINGVITGFLAQAGVTQQQLAGQNFPGIGIMSVGVAHDPSLVCTGNALMGEVAVTTISSRYVQKVPGLSGLGPVDVAPLWRR
jgi:YVTN family beta-propeller protein